MVSRQPVLRLLCQTGQKWVLKRSGWPNSLALQEDLLGGACSALPAVEKEGHPGAKQLCFNDAVSGLHEGTREKAFGTACHIPEQSLLHVELAFSSSQSAKSRDFSRLRAETIFPQTGHISWRSFSNSSSPINGRSTSCSDNEKDKESDARASSPGRALGAVLDGPVTRTGAFLQKKCPAWLWPYVQLARLDKPIGTWLLAWPCFWSIALAAPAGSLPDLGMLALFGIGAVLLRGAGCTVNDLLDRDIDAKVERTKSRPLASKAVTPFAALTFLGVQLSLGLIVLLQLNNFSRVLGAASLLLVFTYPLIKRVTYWPQAYLGLAFNWGALLGWAAVEGSLNLPAVVPLYLGSICWTLVYDTIYAHQDKLDDERVGVKSTALRFGVKTPLWLTGFSVGCIGGLAAAGAATSIGWPYYLGLAAAGSHLAWQVATVDIHSRPDCNAKFSSNKWFGALIFSGILLGRLVS